MREMGWTWPDYEATAASQVDETWGVLQAHLLARKHSSEQSAG